MIGLMLSNRRHTKDVRFLGELFWRCTVFELLTPKDDETCQNRVSKSVFWEKQALNGKISKHR